MKPTSSLRRLSWLFTLMVIVSFYNCGQDDEQPGISAACEKISPKRNMPQAFDLERCGKEIKQGVVNITDAECLGELKGITYIKGALTIYDADQQANDKSQAPLEELDGLRSLTCVSGNLTIKGLSALKNLDGLKGLIYVGGDLIIGDIQAENKTLASLQGLQNLLQVDGQIWIENNPHLGNLQGLQSLEAVGGSLGLFNNESLNELKGLQKLKFLGGFLNVAENQDLPTCEATQLRDNLGDPCRKVCIRKNVQDGCQNDTEGCWYGDGLGH